jgi:hypothetical protein
MMLFLFLCTHMVALEAAQLKGQHTQTLITEAPITLTAVVTGCRLFPTVMWE